MVVEGSVSGIVSLGDNASNTQVHLPEAATRPVAEVLAPAGLVNVPDPAGQVFVGRHDDLQALADRLGGVVVAAMHGLGGIGKSTLAAHYALACRDSVNPVWWITADSPAAIELGLAGLTVALQPELKLAEVPLEMLAERAIGWLSAHRGWLLIADNVTDPADVGRLLARTVAGNGQVLITSRLGEGWHRTPAHLLHLDVLSEDEAIDLLIQIATYGTSAHEGSGPRRPAAHDLDAERWQGIRELVEELGWLPLALDQVGAYMRQNDLSVAAYRRLLARYPATMYDRAARGSDAERTIARIWRVTLDTLGAGSAHTPSSALICSVRDSA
ncbi:NB-ARC domain-containing protein [Herbidospora mongoliensis]|uniref:NB-ARC domain-containing protein n=1 Tax=Herbidospora mongoliensis TaxID=688067 RepID=UPI0008355A4A|nr:NB-ARC domain-containing protein [Herbidospora mongoliensis]